MIERLRALEKAVELVAKATPGPWLYRAKSNTFHGPPPEGTNYSFGYSIMDPDEDYPTFKHEDIDALLAAVNFIREHGSALIAELGQEVGEEQAPAWFYVRTPGADYDYTFTKTREEAIDLQDCDEPDEPIPLYTSPAHTSDARDAEIEAVKSALDRAYWLGQEYWRLADSQSYSDNRRSDETRSRYNQLVIDTLAAMRQEGGSDE